MYVRNFLRDTDDSQLASSNHMNMNRSEDAMRAELDSHIHNRGRSWRRGEVGGGNGRMGSRRSSEQGIYDGCRVDAVVTLR